MSKRKNNRLGKSGITFYTYATECIREKRLAGKHNTADLYRTTCNWICAFWGRRNLLFPEITLGLISRFVAYLQSAGLRVNTVNTYLSNFRSIYNQACQDGLLPVCFVSPFADMARLTTANLYGEEIVYRRKKTGTLIRVGITAGMWRF